MRYEASDKHKHPWQRGRKGSLCPKDADGATLLAESVSGSGRKRYATDGERAYAAAQHRPGLWHGWPVGWKEVPPPIVREWLNEGRVRQRAVKKG